MLRRGLVLLGVVIMGAVLAPEVAGASSGPIHARGNMTANQNTFTHWVKVHGWAFDPDHRTKEIMVRIYVNGRYRGRTMTDSYSKWTNEHYHLTGNHAYTKWVYVPGRAHLVSTRSYGYGTHAYRTKLALHYSSHWYPKPGRRIVTVARRHVGDRYTWGGDSPSTGFDCSGFTKYVYATARVRDLPHQSESQRHVSGIRQISASNARKGDLVFYMSGGSAYHVAIYTGDHRQISAATTRSGVKAQEIYDSNVVYGTITH